MFQSPDSSMMRATAIIGNFLFQVFNLHYVLKNMNSAMIKTFAVIQETDKYRHRRLLQLHVVKGEYVQLYKLSIIVVPMISCYFLFELR